MSDREDSEHGRLRQIRDAVGFQLSMDLWTSVLAGIVFSVVALIVWIIR